MDISTTPGPAPSSLSTLVYRTQNYNFELLSYHRSENKAIIKINGKEYDVEIKLKSKTNNGFNQRQWQALTQKIESLFNHTILTAEEFQQSTITERGILLINGDKSKGIVANNPFKEMNPIVARSLSSRDDFTTEEYGDYSSATPPFLDQRREYVNTANNSYSFPFGSNQSNTPYPSRSFHDHSPLSLQREQSPAASLGRNNALYNSFDGFDFQHSDSEDMLDRSTLFSNSTSTGTLGVSQTQSLFSAVSSFDSEIPLAGRFSASPTTTTTTTSTSTTATPNFGTSSSAIPTIPQTSPTSATVNSSATTTVTSSAVPEKSNDLLNFDDETESITLTLRANAPAVPILNRSTSTVNLLDIPVAPHSSATILIPTRPSNGSEEARILPKDDKEEKKTEGNPGVSAASKEDEREENDQLEEPTVTTPAPQPTKGLRGYVNTAARFGACVATFGGSEALLYAYNWWNKPKATEETDSEVEAEAEDDNEITNDDPKSRVEEQDSASEGNESDRETD